MHRNRVVEGTEWQIGRAEQVEVIADMIEEVVELTLRHLCISEHEGVAGGGPRRSRKHVVTRMPGTPQMWQQVQRYVRIAAQAEARPVFRPCALRPDER